MRRGGVAFSALALIGLGVTGCGLFRFEQREPWRAQAEAACLSQQRVPPSAYMSRASRIEGPGACGIDHPFRVAAFTGGAVALQREAVLACPVIPHIDGWLGDVVQPAAALYFGTAVTEVKSGSYACRSRNGRRGAKLSEHAFGNAFDVMAFRLADGREVTVARGWRGAPDEQAFLREVFVGACGYFTTVLAPGADAFHYDHFHLDLARHDPRGERRICQPDINFTPRLGEDAPQQPELEPLPAPVRPPRRPDVEIEEDEDPPEVSAAPGRRSVAALAGSVQAGAFTPGRWARDGTPSSERQPTAPDRPARPVQASAAEARRSAFDAAPFPPGGVPGLPAALRPPPRPAPLPVQPQLLTGRGIY